MTDSKYVAFDLHKSIISAAVLDLGGKMATQANFKTDASALRDFLRGLSGSVHLTFEPCETLRSAALLHLAARSITVKTATRCFTAITRARTVTAPSASSIRQINGWKNKRPSSCRLTTS